MKRAIRLLIAVVGLLGAYVMVSAPLLEAFDGGPIPMCNPNNPRCIRTEFPNGPK
jgi:hypothetical protein